MCHNATIFKDLDKTYNSTMKVGNGGYVDVKGRGMVAVKTNSGIKLISDVLFVLDISQNLLSVAQMLEKQYSLQFKDNQCIIFDPYGEKLLCMKMKSQSFAINWENTAEYAYARVTQSVSDLWHERFGHYNQRSLVDLKKLELVEDMPNVSDEAQICEICQQGKQARLPLKNNQAWRAIEKLQLIHTGVCGPMKTTSLSGNKYSILFIDDYTRMCWVYFIYLKNEVFFVFKQFKALVENQSNLSIKILRSDNGTKYTSNQFVEFSSTASIECQLTTPYTPQQNGVSKRKNRIVMEMASCLLFEKKMPSNFWAETVNTSVYLLNRLPTKS
ncbi:Retrovirus-related Pol polyprotein from transposon TNT 1-94 [Vitis vinifera]|nr:Retrovirus-related Pol polyprotein from transposon TNT 1-94 [Vitis vinifera]